MGLLPPGGHLAAFGGARTYHRLACAVEDAGFEIRDQLMWLYDSGVPKSHDVAKDIAASGGVEGAAMLERFNSVLIEMDGRYQEDLVHRMGAVA